MPICYQISLDITRQREGEEPFPTNLPQEIRSEEQLTQEQLQGFVSEFWDRFRSFLGDTAPDRAGEYSWAGIFTVVSIFNC